MPRVSLLRTAAICVPVMFLAACGGGGGEDDAPAGPSIPVATGAVITTVNAKAVSADAITASTTTSAAASAGLPVGVQVQPGASGASSTLRLGSIARTMALKAAQRPGLVAGVAIHETEACTFGGSVTLTGNLSDPEWAVQGDTVTTTMNNCRENIDGVATTMNGKLTISVLSGRFYSYAMTPFDVTMKVEAANMTITAGGATSTMHGDMTMRYAANSVNIETIVISGTSMTNMVTGGSSPLSLTMKNYRQEISTDRGPATTTVTMRVESLHPSLGSTAIAYDVSTLTAWKTDEFGNVTAGSLKVAGAGSQVQITVTAENTFEIKVDTNGDGTYDATQTATLSELRSLH